MKKIKCDVRMPMRISHDTATAIEQYTAVALSNAAAGNVTKSDLEEVRSYAVEAITALLRDNPNAFRYAREMAGILDARKKR